MLRDARTLQVSAQAKINLRLRILAREDTGFHQIETLFLRVELADVVRIRRTTRECSLDVFGDVDADALGPVERNLAWRAATAYFAASGESGGWSIELEKRIPIGGGLGGGSADAAAVLRALDASAHEPLGAPELLDLAATLGADVPFLTSEHAYALAWGRGERLLPLQPPPASDVMIVVPAFGVNTASAYGWLDDARSADGDMSEGALQLDLRALSRWDTLRELAVNDFEPVVASRYPEIDRVIDELRLSGMDPVMMSGSGSAVFGIAPPNGVLGRVPLRGATVHLTRTVTHVEPVSPID